MVDDINEIKSIFGVKIKNKDRILGEELNEMILGVKNTLIWMDIYDKDQFQSIQ